MNKNEPVVVQACRGVQLVETGKHYTVWDDNKGMVLETRHLVIALDVWTQQVVSKTTPR